MGCPPKINNEKVREKLHCIVYINDNMVMEEYGNLMEEEIWTATQ